MTPNQEAFDIMGRELWMSLLPCTKVVAVCDEGAASVSLDELLAKQTNRSVIVVYHRNRVFLRELFRDVCLKYKNNVTHARSSIVEELKFTDGTRVIGFSGNPAGGRGLTLDNLLVVRSPQVIQLSKEDAAMMQAAYEAKVQVEKDYDAAVESVRRKYIGKSPSVGCVTWSSGTSVSCDILEKVPSEHYVPGFENGFNFGPTFRFIVPKPPA